MSFLTLSPIGGPAPLTLPTGVPGRPNVQPAFQPPTGYQPFQDLPAGVGVCPPGTRCIGPSAQGPFGLKLCLGTCSPYGQDQPTDLPDSTCSEALRLACRIPVLARSPEYSALCGACNFTTDSLVDPTPTTTRPPTPQGNGNGCQVCAPSCQLPNGRKGRLNKTGYYTQAGYVAPGTKCVKPRTMNVANPAAAKRAIRRLTGHHRQLERTEAALKVYANKRVRRKR